MSYHILTFTSNSLSVVCWENFKDQKSKTNLRSIRRWAQAMIAGATHRREPRAGIVWGATQLLPSVGSNSKLPKRHYTLLQSAHQTRQKATCNYTIRLIHKLPASVYFCCQSCCLLENKGSHHPACLTFLLLYALPFLGALVIISHSFNSLMEMSLGLHLDQVPLSCTEIHLDLWCMIKLPGTWECERRNK